MRKVTKEAVHALMQGHNYKNGNTKVLQINGVNQMFLHGNLIAEHIEGKVQITNAGWFSNTTKERLNGIPGVSISQRKRVWYLNGEKWNGELIEI